MHVGGVMNGRDGLCRGLLTAATPYFLLPAASSFQLPTSYFQLPTSYLLITTCPREESLSLAPVRAPVAVQVKVDVEPEAISSNSLHAYCMLTACSLHAHCMLTACLLHATASYLRRGALNGWYRPSVGVPGTLPTDPYWRTPLTYSQLSTTAHICSVPR